MVTRETGNNAYANKGTNKGYYGIFNDKYVNSTQGPRAVVSKVVGLYIRDSVASIIGGAVLGTIFLCFLATAPSYRRGVQLALNP